MPVSPRATTDGSPARSRRAETVNTPYHGLVRSFPALVTIASALLACGGEPSSSSCEDCGGSQTYAASEDWTRDILHTALDVSLTTLTAQARIELAGSTTSSAASFEASGLTITEVTDGDGEPLEHAIVDGRLDVGLAPSAQPQTLVVDYAFGVQAQFDGLLEGGSTLLWPYHCHNLFPCKSTPDDGLTFELSVAGAPAGQTTVFPPAIAPDAPSYMVAWATGDYTEIELGMTPAGTRLSAWYLPGGQAQAQSGTAHLVDAFAYFEEALGPYAFGDHVGAVAVNWGPGALGGMEHHPYWHVGAPAMGMEDVQIHEAAHGWYGDGVRIACWEDFVLSEGTVSYLTARGMEEVVGAAAAAELWSTYDDRLALAMSSASFKVAWPQGCGAVDILEDGLFSSIPYMKGAMFFRALEGRIGVAALMDVLAGFYLDHVGEAARMQDLLDRIQSDTGYDPTACAEAWLRVEDVPDLDVCP